MTTANIYSATSTDDYYEGKTEDMADYLGCTVPTVRIHAEKGIPIKGYEVKIIQRNFVLYDYLVTKDDERICRGSAKYVAKKMGLSPITIMNYGSRGMTVNGYEYTQIPTDRRATNPKMTPKNTDPKGIDHILMHFRTYRYSNCATKENPEKYQKELESLGYRTRIEHTRDSKSGKYDGYVIWRI